MSPVYFTPYRKVVVENTEEGMKFTDSEKHGEWFILIDGEPKFIGDVHGNVPEFLQDPSHPTTGLTGVGVAGFNKQGRQHATILSDDPFPRITVTCQDRELFFQIGNGEVTKIDEQSMAWKDDDGHEILIKKHKDDNTFIVEFDSDDL